MLREGASVDAVSADAIKCIYNAPVTAGGAGERSSRVQVPSPAAFTARGCRELPFKSP